MSQRILRGTAATLTFYNMDANGKATAAAGALTVGVTKADGTVVVAAGTATSSPATGTYTVALTAAQTATLELLTATWTDAGDASVHTTTHEVVGGYLLTLADIRAFETLADDTTYPDATVIAARAEVEDELEQLREAAFVPRYARLTLDGSGTRELVTGVSWLRTLRTARTLATTGSATSTAFTATELAACKLTSDGRIVRGDGNVFDWGVANIIVEVEHGFTDWGTDLKMAALTRLRERLNRPDSAIPDRALTYSGVDGTTYKLANPDGNSTGNPQVDAVYNRYPRTNPGNQPASRTLVYQPQFGGVFRGGVGSR